MPFRHFISTLLTTTAAGALLAGLVVPSSALAQSATPLPPVAVDTTPGLSSPLSNSSTTSEGLASHRLTTSDTSRLLDDLLGTNSAAGGGISSLPTVHGLGDDRLTIEVEGKQTTSACPNHMNPPTSYINPTRVGKAELWAGITPVSVGGDSIGGTIIIDSPAPVFAAPGEGFHKEGSLSSYYHSINGGFGVSGSVTGAVGDYSLTYTGAWNKGIDYKDGNNHKVLGTSFENSSHGGTFAWRHDGDLFTLQAGQEFVPYEAFPNQRMDLTLNRSTYVNGRYQGDFDWGTLDAKLYWQQVRHKMNFLADKGGAPTGGMPMETAATDTGYSVKAEHKFTDRDTLRLGNEFHHYELTDWWPPSFGGMAPNTFVNINAGRRDRLGTFAEWERKWDSQWTSLLGARNDVVWSDTGNVVGYNGTYATDAAAFNALNHAKTDVNFDLTALARWEPNKTSTSEIGYSRKTRSPNLYERYSWSTGMMASSMVTWFGDGNSYVGNPNLKPEVAHTVSVSTDLHDGGRSDWSVKLTPYYTFVENYINVRATSTMASGGGTAGTVLQFINQNAEIYGIDLSGQKTVWESDAYGKGVLKAKLGWLHGQTTSGDALYHMMPLNGKLALEHSLGGWTSAIEAQLVDGKSQTDPVRREPFTPGYTLINLRTGYQWRNVRFDVGIDNLLNKKYYLPLGGVDYTDYKQGLVGAGSPLPGPGRSYNAAVTVKF